MSMNHKPLQLLEVQDFTGPAGKNYTKMKQFSSFLNKKTALLLQICVFLLKQSGRQ